MPHERFDVNARSLQEVLSLGHLQVPIYQRAYSWREEQVGQLWDDISLAMEEGEDEYFIGAMVLERQDDRSFAIIDGQQRLATLSVFVAAVRDAFEDLGKAKQANMLHSFVIRETLAEERTPVLALSDEEGRFFESQIQARKQDREPWTRKKRGRGRPPRMNIKEAYEYTAERITEELDGLRSKRKASRLTEIGDYLCSKVVAVTTIVDSDTDAYVVFETINDRGLDLSIADLLKNHLFSLAEKRKRLHVMIKSWEEVTSLLEGLSFARFLRHYWLSAHDRVTQRNLYKRIKEHVRQQGRGSCFTLADSLSEAARAYRDLCVPSSEDPLARDLTDLRDMSAQQFLPLMLAAKTQGLGDKELRAILSVCESITVRYQVVADKNPNRLEAWYSQWARGLRERGPRFVSALPEEAREVCPNDDEFEAGFRALDDLKVATARYLLRKLNARAQGVQMEVKPPSDVHVEHILPVTPSDEWLKVFPKNKASQYVQRLGNLTLLAESLNKRASNKAFTDKAKDFYQESGIRITSELTELDKWDAEAIEARQDRFAKMAREVWAF